MSHRRALTLVEALVVLFVLALIVAVLIPAIPPAHAPARIMASQSNMKQLAQGNANIAAMQDDAIAGYGFNPELIASSGIEPGHTVHAAQIEQTLILQKATGRTPVSDHPIDLDMKHIAQSRYLHVPLIDAMTGQQPEPVAASPMDDNLLDFQENPLDCEALPGGDPATSFGDWTDTQAVVRWPYASSYLSTVSAWSPDKPGDDGHLAVEPGPDASTLRVRDPSSLGGRKMTEIAFPSMKAFFFEEFDYTHGKGKNSLFYADPNARVNVQFFDSSVRLVTARDANPGWDTAHPFDPNAHALIRYRPIDTRYFPTYSNGDAFGAPYRWTRGGLLGVDVGGNEIDTSGWRDD
ncbi:MAG: prepilin-type N-terminal cleavage/methylation domain-containing protein [Phycisphaeraceae bacterium]|nr:MAG: prepilin-type N-terminal cleavage/methylation domain-containing protein [Phycisphaeraceae bacterium]